MSCVRTFEQFDWLAASDAVEKLKSIRLSSTCVAEPLDATIVRNKQCKYNSRSALRGKKIRLVETRLYESATKTYKIDPSFCCQVKFNLIKSVQYFKGLIFQKF